MNVKKMVGLLAAMTLALTIAACGADAGEDATAVSGGGLGDAVEVHGNWKIDVVDPDGSVANGIEFHNEFVGQTDLSRVLAGEANVDNWRVQIGSETPICPTGTVCLDVAEATRDGDSLVLTVDLEPTAAGDIIEVSADLAVRIVDTGELVVNQFSRKSLLDDGGPGAVPVEAGQTVQVEVTYTFA